MRNGDIQGIRALLQSGSASLNDVDPYGLGLLYVSNHFACLFNASLTASLYQYAAYYCWRAQGRDSAMKTCQFLLELGAHAEWEDEIGKYVCVT